MAPYFQYYAELAVFCYRPLLLSALLGIVVPSGGCVALNIPSQRYDDPSDRGGIFGPHRPRGQGTPVHPVQVDGALPSIDDSYCPATDTSAWEEGVEEPEKTPEVPWPRFHPLPTRPVFSSPAPEFWQPAFGEPTLAAPPVAAS